MEDYAQESRERQCYLPVQQQEEIEFENIADAKADRIDRKHHDQLGDLCLLHRKIQLVYHPGQYEYLYYILCQFDEKTESHLLFLFFCPVEGS